MSARLRRRLDRIAVRPLPGCRSCGGKGRIEVMHIYDGREPVWPPPCPECGAQRLIVLIPRGPHPDDAADGTQD